ncbi:MAG: GNAT family N-acetyltransferase [Halobacteriota archaeon]|nr:GNAT family N-acetyltransferase [Halobacteriota archaeon]
MEQKISIREAREEDLVSILELYKDLHESDDPLPDDSELKCIWKEILENPLLKYYVLIYEGEVVSTCALSIILNLTRGARPYGVIENVVTQNKHQGKGFGTALLTYVLKISWELNCYKVMLLTSRKEERIFKFYENLGFERGVKTGFIKYSDDRP